MNILDLASIDFTLIRETPNIYTTKEHDSLKFFVSTNSWYWYTNRVGGTLKFYLKYFWNLDEDSVEEVASSYNDSTKPSQTLYDEPYIREYPKVFVPYYETRGINSETVKDYGLEYDDLYEAIVLPITNLKGRRIGNIVRKMKVKDKSQRYKFILWDNVKPPLWQFHRLSKVNGETKILLFEGVWSTMFWKQTLRHQNVETFAVLGTFPSKTLAELLSGLNIFYFPDYDEPGKNAAQQVKSILPKCNFIYLDKMPDEVTEDEVNYVFSNFMQ